MVRLHEPNNALRNRYFIPSMYSIELNINHIAFNYFTFHPMKRNCLWCAVGWWCSPLAKVHETRSNMRIAGHWDSLQAKGTGPSNSLWQAFPSFHRRNAQRHSSPIKFWPGFNQGFYNYAIVLFINDPMYWHLTGSVVLRSVVKSGENVWPTYEPSEHRCTCASASL